MRASEFGLPEGMKVYLDMDGVIANFFEEYAKLAGVKSYRDVPAAKVDPTLDKMIGTDFFNKLPKFPVSDKIVSIAIQAGGGYGIISSPLRNDFKNSERWKREWIKRELNPQPEEIFITPNKAVHAVTNGVPNVLIDDRGDNISKWEAAGGIGIKFQADEDSLKVILDGLKRARRIGDGDEKLEPQKLKSRNLGSMIATDKEESINNESNLVLPVSSVRGVVVDLIKDKIEKERDLQKVSTWLKFIVGKTIKARGDRYTITSEDVLQALTVIKESIDEDFENVADIDLTKALDTMAQNAVSGERLKDVFIMRNKHNMTFKQIGDEIGTGLDRARQIYQRALRNLRFLLKDYVKENFADGKVNEVLDKPAPYTWSKDEFGFPTATAKDLGLHIAFDGRNQPDWEVSFYREQDNGNVVMNRPTGQGREFQVFATVNAAIKDFIKMHPDAEGLTLDARKDGGVDGQGRVSLYRRMMDSYAKKLGWEFKEWDQGQMVMMGIYKPRTNENFADGKVKGKSRPGRVKRSGASCNGSVTDLRKRAKNASGEKAKMYHWCANMKSGKKK